MRDSYVLRHEACPKCRENGRDKSGNNLAVYSDGHSFCFSCDYYIPSSSSSYERESIVSPDQLDSGPLLSRGISEEVARYYGAKIEYDPATGEEAAYYYPLYREGTQVGYQRRILPKEIDYLGNVKGSSLFGSHVVGRGGKMIVLTEGAEDCMAAYQMFKQQGKNYKVVASLGLKYKRHLEFLESFDHVVICYDQDEPGQEAAKGLAESLSVGKAKVMRFDRAKDPNEMLEQGRSSDFLNALYRSEATRPDGIVSGQDTWDVLANRPPVECVPYPEGWKDMNEMTYGLRLGELDTWTSGSGMGKTSVLRELEYHLFLHTQDNIGVINLEEPLHDSVEAIMSLHLNQRIHLPDVRAKISDEVRYQAWQETVGTGRFHFYDHFGSVAEDSLINKIRYLAKGLGCKYIFLDHLSIVVSEFADEGDERQRIDSIMTKLKKLTQELNIWIGMVVHLRKTGGGTSFEEGGVPTLDDLRGSGSLKQLSNSVFALSRNQQHEDVLQRNVSQLHVLKCRFTGRTGKADKLMFNHATGRTLAYRPESQDD